MTLAFLRVSLSKLESSSMEETPMTADQQVMKLWAGGYNPLQIAERLSMTVSRVNLILSPALENHHA